MEPVHLNPDGTLDWGPIGDEHEDADAAMGRHNANGELIVDDESEAVFRRMMSYRDSWGVDRVLAPLSDESGLFNPRWDREYYLMDHGYRRHSRHRFPLLDAYYTTFRLTYRASDRTAGFVDSTGVAHRMPAGVARLYKLRVEAEQSAGFGLDRQQNEAFLLFQDADGRALLMLPGYGWSEKYQTDPLAKACGWTLDGGWNPADTWGRFIKTLEPELPGILTCPLAPIGRALVDEAERTRQNRSLL